ncbi:hypothetical protein ABW20_dc0109291 [Dactylellina cionopaga]|nr:hypothetical protein ABW20_dc0109291 [Dactylellina cionopaga]
MDQISQTALQNTAPSDARAMRLTTGIGGKESETFKLTVPIESVPTEILLEIVKHLPDIADCMHLGMASRTLHAQIQGSGHFWFRFGKESKIRKDFTRYSKSRNYQKYLVRIARGEFKTRCQFCFRPQCGIIRSEVGKIACIRCMDDRTIWFNLSRDRNNGECSDVYWLPAVIRTIKSGYAMGWEEIVEAYLQDVGPLVTATTNKKYLLAVVKKLCDAIFELFDNEHSTVLAPFISTTAVKRQYINTLNIQALARFKDLGIFAPTEGQRDRMGSERIAAEARAMVVCLVGPFVSTPDGIVRDYGRGLLSRPIFDTIRRRLRLNKRWLGACALCQQPHQPNTLLQAMGNLNMFSPSQFIQHVADYHPARLLTLDASLWTS